MSHDRDFNELQLPFMKSEFNDLVRDRIHAGCESKISEDAPGPPQPTFDPIEKARHYNVSPARCSQCCHPIECIDVIRHMNFCLGNLIKYIWRAEHKGNALEDLKKARYYLDREIERREAGQ